MPLEEKEEQISHPGSEESIVGVSPEEKPWEVPVAQEKAVDKSEVIPIDPMEEKIAEQIKQIKEEKKRIILEEVEKGEIPEQIRPFVKEDIVDYRVKPKTEEIEPLERHNVIIGEKPVQLFLILIILSIIVYLLYRYVLEEKPSK